MIRSTSLLLALAAAWMLSACSNSMERFASNNSNGDPIYTANVPG